MMRVGTFIKQAKRITAAVMILFMCSSFVVFADDEVTTDPDAQAAAKATADGPGINEDSDSGDGSSPSAGGDPANGPSPSNSSDSNGEASPSNGGDSSNSGDSGDGAFPSGADSSLDLASTADPAVPDASTDLPSSTPTGSGDDPADTKSDDPAASTKPVPGDDSADKKPAVPKVSLFNYANGSGFAGDYSADNNGNVIIDNFLFSSFEPGAYASESIVMMLGDTIYSFTIYSDGFILGELPEGFTISGRKLIITGINENMEIAILEQTALSSTFEEPYFEEPDFKDPGVKGPDKTSAKIKHNGTTGSVTTMIPFVDSVDAMSVEPAIDDPAADDPDSSDQASATDSRGLGETSSPPPFGGLPPIGIVALMLTVGGMIIVPKFIL